MRTNSRGFVLLQLLVILLFVGMGVNAYFDYFRHQGIDNPPILWTPGPVAGWPWPTYRNVQYGFEVKYPSDWKVQENIIKFTGSHPYVVAYLSKAGARIDFCLDCGGYGGGTVTESSVAGIKATRVDTGNFVDVYGFGNAGGINNIRLKFNNQRSQKIVEEFNLILSTFKFVK